MLDWTRPTLSIRRQCELLGLHRSTVYYRPVGEAPMNLELKRAIDERYTARPSTGVPRMTASLRREGWAVNPKRIRRLMREMGLMAIYPKRRLTTPDKAHPKFPYLLRGMAIDRADQVWATDITYIRLHGGFVYLVAILDWYSRYVLAWELSNSMDAAFCVSALQSALRISKPEIFNSDQGSQFTSDAFTGRLKDTGIRISMCGQGRVFDNIFVERLWRTVKYEEVYLKDYSGMPEAQVGLADYFAFYNQDRPHQALGWRTPAEVYFGNREANGGPKGAAAAATPVALRAPSVAAAAPDRFHLNSENPWS